MLRRLLKIVGGLVAVLVLIAAAGGGWAATHWKRTFEAPLPEIRAGTDSAVIARGRYLVYGPARCAECHTQRGDSVAGPFPPLAGGVEFVLPIGTIRTPNLTSDSSLGIGRFSDGQLARVLRHGVRPDGRAIVPFMEFQDLSDDDLAAVISFLRTQPPVARQVADHEFNGIGKAVMAFMIKPAGPTSPPAAHSPADSATVERGAYLANTVAQCMGCHSQRSHVDGSYLNDRFSGGGIFENANDPTSEFVSPNLTPARAGRITPWSEEQFVTRFRSGVLLPGSPMPWTSFGRMTDQDIRALFRYLRTLAPVEVDPGPSMRKKAG